MFISTRGQAAALLRNELTDARDTQLNTGEAEQQLSRRRKFIETLKDSAAPMDSNVSSV